MHPFLEWQSSKHYIFWVCVCSLSYPACNALAPYCQLLWPVRPYSIFPHRTHDNIFGRNIFYHKNMFWFHLQLPSEASLALRSVACDVKCSFLLSDFNETWNFRKEFRKVHKYQTSCQSVQWGPNCSMRTDGQTWRSLTFDLQNFANASKNTEGKIFNCNANNSCNRHVWQRSLPQTFKRSNTRHFSSRH